MKMLGKISKIAVLVIMTVMIFRKGTRGQLCTGNISGLGGFCIDSHDSGRLGSCIGQDFAIEGDFNSKCPQSSVGPISGISDVQDICCVPDTDNNGNGAGAQFCTGEASGGQGFCISALDQAQVNLCENQAFSVEGDVNRNCPSTNVS
jgi:hypothetical protein